MIFVHPFSVTVYCYFSKNLRYTHVSNHFLHWHFTLGKNHQSICLKRLFFKRKKGWPLVQLENNYLYFFPKTCSKLCRLWLKVMLCPTFSNYVQFIEFVISNRKLLTDSREWGFNCAFPRQKIKEHKFSDYRIPSGIALFQFPSLVAEFVTSKDIQYLFSTYATVHSFEYGKMVTGAVEVIFIRFSHNRWFDQKAGEDYVNVFNNAVL